MVLDKVLFKKLNTFSKNLCNSYNIKEPKSRDTLCTYLTTLENALELGEINSLFIGMTLYEFITSKDVRDRHTTARIFEDIFGELIGVIPTDTENRTNPETTDTIRKYDSLCSELNWKISTDLSSNKREKSDHKIDNYKLSIKTLKGKLYDINGNIEDNSFNGEINIGSLSHRAIFLGLTDRPLTDRRGGLGSATQMTQLLNKLKQNGKFDEFKKRINNFVNYVYEDDILIIYKSGYKMDITLIPSETFVNAINIALSDKYEITDFTKIWSRWENNNLRINYLPLMKVITEQNLKYYKFMLDLENVYKEKQFIDNIKIIYNLIDEKIEDLL
jgi:hypothetical protein